MLYISPMRLNSGYFKIALFTVLISLQGCSSTDYVSDVKTVRPVRTVAILPFTVSGNVKKEIGAEAESRFRKAFVDHKYEIIGKDRVDAILKEKEFASESAAAETVKSIGVRLGADAVLTGEVTELSEYQKGTRDYDSFIYGSRVFGTDSEKVYEIMAYPYLKFQIVVTLVIVTEENGIIIIKNPEDEVKKDIYAAGYSSLDSYRNMVLDRLIDDLIKRIEQAGPIRK